jgi:hypothetical protein
LGCDSLIDPLPRALRASRQTQAATVKRVLPQVKLTYTDKGHIYMINGTRASGVSTTAKIPPSSYAIEQYDRRMVAIGCALEPNICENILMDLEDKDGINKQVEDAKYVAKQHVKADRGTQKHRVLELILTGREHQLLSQQQRNDADILRRTLDAYHLTPHEGLIEQFVVYPEHSLAGRFDVVMRRNDGSLVVVDLKSGINAILYPQTTMVQLALYAHAPMVSEKIEKRSGKAVVDEWREMPEKLDLTRAYVLLVENDAKIGTFHRIDIEHGWAGATHALNILKWRKALGYNGRGGVVEVLPEEPIIMDESVHQGYLEMTARATNRRECTMLASSATEQGCLTDELRTALNKRWTELKADV